MAKMLRIKAEEALLGELRERLKNLRELLPTLARPAANKAMIELLTLMGEIEEARNQLDPIKEPGASFDPTNPDTVGRLVALALMAQNKVPIARIARTYGSGVYAIYYEGGHPAYAGISRTETPIYVGKADPQNAEARTSREQGPRLFGRLDDHSRMIKTVAAYATENKLPNPLRVEDFTCRRLVCATNAQLVAERHLISTFKPIWNSETGICWGISKHGDSAKTRANKRSPWDVMHPGRAWAMAESLADKSTPAEITKGIAEHLTTNPPYRDRDSLIQHFLNAFIQRTPLTGSAMDNETESASE